MKKMATVFSIVLMSSQVFAAATLRIPVIINFNDTYVSANSVNQRLAAVGAPRIPLYIEISSDENAYKKMSGMQAMLANSLKPLNQNGDYVAMASEGVPTDNNTLGYITCYKGNAEEILDIVNGLVDVHYSDQLQVWGYKYKSTTFQADEEAETSQYLNDESALWRNWGGQTEDLLILSATNDSGDDVNESLIPKCQ